MKIARTLQHNSVKAGKPGPKKGQHSGAAQSETAAPRDLYVPTMQDRISSAKEALAWGGLMAAGATIGAVASATPGLGAMVGFSIPFRESGGVLGKTGGIMNLAGSALVLANMAGGASLPAALMAASPFLGLGAALNMGGLALATRG